MRSLFLFDIDNTLLWSGGAGGLAMGLAFRDMFGIDDGFRGVEFSGRTDRFILAEALRHHGIDGDYAQHQDRFLERYYDHLPKALRERKGRLMPGFPMLLEDLAQRAGARLGLATGNFRRAAQLKLAHYGIHDYFADGGFGEESEERSAVVRCALERMADGSGGGQAVIIGDTTHDVQSAKDNDSLAAAVATGSNSVGELRRAGADLVFEDFSDWRTASARLAGEI